MNKNRNKKRSFGAIRLLPSGKYQATYQDTYGNKFTAPDTFAIYEEADLFLAEKQVEICRGLFINPRRGKITLRQWWITYSDTRQDWSAATRYGNEHRARTYLLASFPNVCLADTPLLDITPYSINLWWSNVQKATELRTNQIFESKRNDSRHARHWAYANNIKVSVSGRLKPAIIEQWQAAGSPSSSQLAKAQRIEKAGATAAAHSYKLLKQLFTAAVNCDLVYKNPVNIKAAGKVEVAERKGATDEQVRDLAQAVPLRYCAAVRVAAYSGLRQGELFALQRQDYDQQTKTITVNKAKFEVNGVTGFKSPKTKSSYRAVTLPDTIAKELDIHLQTYTDPSPSALIFTTELGTVVKRATLYSWYNPARQRLNLGWLRWHDLRHTSQGAAARTGASIKDLMNRLGHSTSKAAMIYLHKDPKADSVLAGRIDENIIQLKDYRSA